MIRIYIGKLIVSFFAFIENCEKKLLGMLCKIRGRHRYVNRKCDLCKFELKVIHGGKSKNYQITGKIDRMVKRTYR